MMKYDVKICTERVLTRILLFMLFKLFYKMGNTTMWGLLWNIWANYQYDNKTRKLTINDKNNGKRA